MQTNSPLLLALDTSTRMVGVAIYDGVSALAELTWSSKDFHTVELAPAVHDTLTRIGSSPADVNAIVVAIGPGSFTGLRIGLALAKGMVLALRIPIIGVPTLDVLATAQAIKKIPMAAVLRVGRGRLAVGWYHVQGGAWRSSGKLEIKTAEELAKQITAPVYICGELDENEVKLLREKATSAQIGSPAQSLRRPAYLAEIGWQRWKADMVDDPATLSPLYLHYNDPIPG